MGNQKQKWTSEEEEALKAGVRKHGAGKWKNILNDPEFAPSLTSRSNIDLKDKWRNLSFSSGAQGSRDKSRMHRVRPMTTGALANAPVAASAVPMVEDGVVDDSLKSPRDTKIGQKYNEMIFEALSSIKDANGSDIGAIVAFIEQRNEVPQNFKRLLGSKLRRLVMQGKLEKVQNCYKIKDAALGTKTPTPQQKDIRPRPEQNSGEVMSVETLEDAAVTAACKVAEADNKSFVAAEAVREAERVSKMAEDTDSLLQLVKEIYEQCSDGRIVLLF